MDAQQLKERLLSLVTVFEEKEELLTSLDREIGDGDHGVNMLRGFKSLEESIDDTSVQTILKTTGMTLMSKIGGASGPLYGFAFVKMSNVESDDIHDYLQAFSEAVKARGKVELNEKTMYDVIERARQMKEKAEKVTIDDLQQLADNTKDMIATKGRASYFNENSKGHIDPGAQSSVYILNALIGDE